MSDADMRRIEAEAKHHAMLEQAKVRGAEAKSAKDWVELFQEITENSVKTLMESQGQGHLVLEKLAPWRSAYAHVSRELHAHGLPLNESIEIEGPVMGHTATGLPIIEDWPTGLWAKFHWPDGSRLQFRGNAAIVAVTFWMWWVNFQDVHRQQLGVAAQAEARSRIILPGSPDSISYHRAKKDDK